MIAVLSGVATASLWGLSLTTIAVANDPDPHGPPTVGTRYRCVEYKFVDQLADGEQGGCGCNEDSSGCEVSPGGACDGFVLTSQQHAECVEDPDGPLSECNVYLMDQNYVSRRFECDSYGDSCGGGCECEKVSTGETAVRQKSTCKPPPGQGNPV